MANSRSGESVVDRIIKLLSAFERSNPKLSMSELARHTQLPTSTTHRLATELWDAGFLDRDEEGRFGIGVRMWELAARSNPLEEFRQRGLPVLEGIQEAVRQHVSLSVPSYEDFTVLYLERLDKHGSAVNLAEVAGRLDMHTTSAGLAMLAFAPHRVREQFLDGPLSDTAPGTEIQSARLRAQLAQYRDRGFVRLAGVLVKENVAYSVPVVGRGSEVLGAITVVSPLSEDNAQLVIPVLVAAGRSLSRSMGSERRPYGARSWLGQVR
ncbi:IclR family transcriptional regulator [Glutamicibacter sp. MNS18]|uniref:IclR family transcriptional regulator n=1 Tax=Glutamicibacter sp. MNS18 TaxID=2989817 RepID=UPI002235804E|nr:IclR family transcriptional regulator [Glutamicibacter sp. MNS18]MCW4464730.1 IclR family transcriptional regulator [Glutamicibacter sp. MNS18]